MQHSLLLVDDDPGILNALKRALRQEDYLLLTANNGEDALALVSQHRFNVIISDQRMPHMSGVEFLEQVREMSPGSIRIVLSAYRDFDTIKTAIDEGIVSRLLIKPWEDNIIRDNIRAAFKHADLNFLGSEMAGGLGGDVCMFVMDADGVIQLVNPKFESVIGICGAELIGNKWRSLVANHQVNELFDIMWKTLGEMGYWQGEICHKCQDGEVREQWLALNMVKDKAGRPHHYIGVCDDMLSG